MRRADTCLLAAVGALGAFVGAQIARRPPAPQRMQTEHVVSRRSAEPKASNAARTAGKSPEPTPSDAAAAPQAIGEDASNVLARIAGTPGTYMPDMLDDLHGQLVRWPDRRAQGLRVWVQTNSPVHDFDLRYAQMARDAFADWSGDGVPLRFDFVLDSASADVRIVWLEHFAPDDGQRVGTTRRMNDQHGWIVHAEISVAIHDSAGSPIPPPDLAGIVRHEAGHALGLGHSRDPRTKMYPVETVDVITPADRATLRLLYSLSPGRVN